MTDHASKSAETPASAFSAAFEQARTAAEDFTKMFGQMKLPVGLDSSVLMGAHRRNIEALTAANRIALEGAQAVARRHFEIMQQTAGELTEALRELASGEAPQAKAAAQAEMLKRAYERAVANSKELAELIQRSNSEAIGALNARFGEAMEEIRALVASADKGK
jgi:phasin family protein